MVEEYFNNGGEIPLDKVMEELEGSDINKKFKILLLAVMHSNKKSKERFDQCGEVFITKRTARTIIVAISAYILGCTGVNLFALFKFIGI